MLWVRVPSPTPDKKGIGATPDPLVLSTLGRRQVVRQGTLTPSSAGSSPAVPASKAGPRRSPFSGRGRISYDPVAQSAEQLPFKQWVRGSNPRRVTKKDTTFVVSFFFWFRPRPCSSFSTRKRFAGSRRAEAAGFGGFEEDTSLPSTQEKTEEHFVLP